MNSETSSFHLKQMKHELKSKLYFEVCYSCCFYLLVLLLAAVLLLLAVQLIYL